MNYAKILDCTLRDGAYLVDKKFGDNTIHGIISGLEDANIDIIEIGFLQDEGMGEGKTVYKNAGEAKKFIPKEKGNTIFAALADYSRYSIENLEENDGTSIDAVRACFFKNERYDVIEFCKEVKRKGYKLFVQPVDILGYTDSEIIELIENVNELEPYCFSIVDTFGSMYADDLQRVFSLIDHNLVYSSKIGFHSHNNMQMSNALSQEFLKISYGKREVVVDTTISGMGRGAGNTPTELVAQYMVSKLGYNYDIDAILDVIDTYMDKIRTKCEWGYNTPYFIAGSYSAHVNNISYLTQKPTIRSKDIRYILNKIGSKERKRYNYDLLEKTYMDYMESDIDDSEFVEKLKKEFKDKNVCIIAPGTSIKSCEKELISWIEKNSAIVITVNFLHDSIKSDYLFISNIRRYNYWKNDENFETCKRIVTSNLHELEHETNNMISFTKIVKCGWKNMDNATILLLRLLDMMELKSLSIAGLDGYDNANNYLNEELEVKDVRSACIERNVEIQEMLIDYMKLRVHDYSIQFITDTRFKL